MVKPTAAMIAMRNWRLNSSLNERRLLKILIIVIKSLYKIKRVVINTKSIKDNKKGKRCNFEAYLLASAPRAPITATIPPTAGSHVAQNHCPMTARIPPISATQPPQLFAMDIK